MCSQSYWQIHIIHIKNKLNKKIRKQEKNMKAPLLLVLLLTTVFYAEGNCPDDSNGLLEKNMHWIGYATYAINNSI